MWHAVEVERSASDEVAIDRKLGPSRIARDRGEVWPVLVIAGKGVRSDKGRLADMTAARRFAARGSDLPLLSMPFHQAMVGSMTGPKPAWLWQGKTVSISHLRTIVNRADLIERLGGRAW